MKVGFGASSRQGRSWPGFVWALLFASAALSACQTTGASDTTLASVPDATDTPAAARKPEAEDIGALTQRRLRNGVLILEDKLLDALAPHQATILRLRRAKVAFERIPDVETKRGCGYSNGVEMTGVDGTPFTAPATVQSTLALRFAVWIKETVRPAAQKIFKQPIQKIVVWSSYSCRNARGRRWGGMWHRLSQHAYGNAIDLGGFVLEDGTFVAFKAHWHKKGPKSIFLKSITASACAQFSKVLTPDYDRIHRNHLHLDLAKDKLCGMKKPSAKVLNALQNVRVKQPDNGQTGPIAWLKRRR